MIRLFVKDVSVIGRNTAGVRLMKLEVKEKVVAVEKLSAPENGEPSAQGNGRHDDGDNGKGGESPKKPMQDTPNGSEKKSFRQHDEPIIIA